MLLEAVMNRVLADAGVSGIGSADEGVELNIRQKGQKKWIFVINHTNQEARYQISDGAECKLVSGEKEGLLQPFEIHLYQKE